MQNVVKQAFTETSASGTELTINNTIEARMEMKLNGNTSQNGEPTPATPQEIHCVKGNNVVKVTNQNLFDESEEYPINLGSLELCKIGDYQDYLFKNNGKWYVHKEIGKKVLDGSENWALSSLGAGRFYLEIPPIFKMIRGTNMGIKPYSSHFVGKDKSLDFENGKVVLMTPYFDKTDQYFARFENDNTPTLSEWKTWLSNNNVTLYYVLATPTEEEITNTTLITQLNEISQALSKKGTTIISQNNDDLPFNLDVIALTK